MRFELNIEILFYMTILEYTQNLVFYHGKLIILKPIVIVMINHQPDGHLAKDQKGDALADDSFNETSRDLCY